MRKAVACAAAFLCMAVALDAQQGSTYIAIDDRVMPFVEHLIRSGVIADPDPMTRPLKRDALLDQLRRADTTTAPDAARAMIREVANALTPRAEKPVVGLHFTLGGSAGTHSRRDQLREAGPRFGAIYMEMDIWTALGPLVLSSRPVFNQRVRKDPDYPGLRYKPLPLRFEDSYVSYQPRYAELMFGTVARNWGPSGIEGLALSNAPYSYDHFYLRLGIPNFRVETQIAQLNDTFNSFGVLEHRWYVAHRFLFRMFPWMTAVLGQSALWKGGGPAEQTGFLNPTRLAVYTREADGLEDSANVTITGDLRLQLPGKAVFQAQALIDDQSVLGTRSAPDRMAGTMVLDVPVGRGASVRGIWTVVSSLAYRTFEGPITYLMRHNVGLGRNFSDYSQWTLTGSVAPRPRIVLSPEATLLLQGEGDIRKPMPPFPAGDYPFILVGTKERVVRLAMNGRTLAWHRLDVDANAGVHFISNRGNVAGSSATCFVGSISVRYRFGADLKAP